MLLMTHKMYFSQLTLDYFLVIHSNCLSPLEPCYPPPGCSEGRKQGGTRPALLEKPSFCPRRPLSPDLQAKALAAAFAPYSPTGQTLGPSLQVSLVFFQLESDWALHFS